MLTTSFIFAPFPISPKKNDFFPITSNAGIAKSYSAYNKKKAPNEPVNNGGIKNLPNLKK